MSTFVCLCVCVCLSVREHISRTTRAIFTRYFMHIAYRRGSVLLRRGNAIPRAMGSFGGFLPHLQCIVQHSMWDHAKMAEPIEVPFGFITRMSPRYHVLGGTRSPKGKGQFLGSNGTLYGALCKNGGRKRRPHLTLVFCAHFVMVYLNALKS